MLLSIPLIDTKTGTDVPLGKTGRHLELRGDHASEPGAAVDVAVGFTPPTDKTTESAHRRRRIWREEPIEHGRLVRAKSGAEKRDGFACQPQDWWW